MTFLALVTLGEGVETIDDSAIYLCSSLKNIPIPSLITSI